MYKMTLTDGTVVEFSGMNGTNFIVPDGKSMDTSVFTNDNLADVIIVTEANEVYECQNLAFTQQQKQLNGDYYICFHERSEEEIALEEIEDLLVQVAEIEVNAGSLQLESIHGSLRNAVKVKLDDDNMMLDK